MRLIYPNLGPKYPPIAVESSTLGPPGPGVYGSLFLRLVDFASKPGWEPAVSGPSWVLWTEWKLL